MNKYYARKTIINGITFDSGKEANRYSELRLLERAGVISRLELQPKFPLKVNGVLVCSYHADYCYFENNARVVEDVKSEPTKTPVYRVKIKLLLALNPGLDHREV